MSPYSHNISFSPSSLHFRPDFSLLPIVYLPPPRLSGRSYSSRTVKGIIHFSSISPGQYWKQHAVFVLHFSN